MVIFKKVDDGFSVKINTRGCELTSLPLKDIIDSIKETRHCLLSLKDGTFVKDNDLALVYASQKKEQDN